MIKPGSLLVAVALAAFAPAGFCGSEDARGQVLQVVEQMNAAWSDQDLSRCISYYSEDTDWENGFGWSIHGRDALGRFLGDWLFVRYPKQEQGPQQVRASSTVEFLTPDLALVDTARRIGPQDGAAPSRLYRATHLVRREDGTWLIWKTRIWEPRSFSSAPEQFVAPSRFPELFDER